MIQNQSGTGSKNINHLGLLYSRTQTMLYNPLNNLHTCRYGAS